MPRSRAAAPELDELPFEEALQRLETVVDRLEQGDLELEASLAAFEQGVALSRRCASQLEAAEQRIEVLIREGGQWLARPFDPQLEGDDLEEEAPLDEAGEEDALEEADD